MKVLKNEENARQMKEDIMNLKMGSGSTVCSEASTSVGPGASGTFAGPPVLASRYNDVRSEEEEVQGLGY